MSKQRRIFSAKFKSDLVIELLKGEKNLNTLAVENNLQPNLFRNWKKEFLDNASVVFDDKREEKLAVEHKEKSEYEKNHRKNFNARKSLITCIQITYMGCAADVSSAKVTWLQHWAS